jgi:thiol-disulfide isomerase/thioredoxin
MKAFVTGIILFVFIQVQAQSPNRSLKEPEIGKLCPNVVFDKIDFYKTRKLSISEMKGKWVILDFWSRFCSGCVGSFPRISKEQLEFRDSVQFIMIAPDSTTGERELYADYHKKLDLKMPCAFDADLFHSFNVGQLPHTIIIDPNGIVKAVTLSPDPVKLRELINGGQPIFSTASYANKKEQEQKVKYDSRIPYLIYGNGGTDSAFLFRSLLAQWKPNGPIFGDRSKLGSGKNLKYTGRFELSGKPINILYLAAYSGRAYIGMDDSTLYGSFFQKPIFEIKDTSILRYDYVTGENLYSYSLIVPESKATESYMMQVMQSDLKNYFAFDVCIESRKILYWKLIATDVARKKLMTKYELAITNDNGRPWQKLSLRNCTMANFMKFIDLYSGVTKSGAPLLDETGITTNIDIDLDWAKGDYEVCRKALQKNGLDLVRGEKELRCIVIKDPKSGALN